MDLVESARDEGHLGPSVISARFAVVLQMTFGPWHVPSDSAG